ncbi:4246_t:CDS:2, partial [Acaulospora morrowiae]
TNKLKRTLSRVQLLRILTSNITKPNKGRATSSDKNEFVVKKPKWFNRGPKTSDPSNQSSKKTVDCQEMNEKINDYVEVEKNAGDSSGSSKTCRSWVLRSGTDVGEVLARYVETIPEAQRCLNLAYWNILDLTDDILIGSLFSENDWEEITESFEKDVTLIESDIPDAAIYFFDEVEKITSKEDEKIIEEIERLSPEIIEKNNGIELTNDEKDIVNSIRRAVITYAENLKELESSSVSKSDFDNKFPNMLTKRFLNKEDIKMDFGGITCLASSRRRNEGRSVFLHEEMGQKCDFRGTLKNSVDSLEAMIGLRSGGLPVANRGKILEDRWIYETYGMDCKATNIYRFGRLSHTKMPNTQKSLAILEGFYGLMSDIK